jgi:hypothetical protein
MCIPEAPFLRFTSKVRNRPKLLVQSVPAPSGARHRGNNPDQLAERGRLASYFWKSELKSNPVPEPHFGKTNPTVSGTTS